MSDDLIRQALKMMPYGFYAITTRSGDDVNAMVANWVLQSAFEPRQVTLAIQSNCYTRGLIEKAGAFCVNIFRAEDEDAVKPFAKGRAKNPDKMKAVVFTDAPETGCPVLDGSAAFIECRVTQIVDTGADHDLIVGEVAGAGVSKPGEAGETLTLVHLGWSYAG